MDNAPINHLDSKEENEEELELVVPPPEDVEFCHKVVRYQIPVEMLDPDAVKVIRRLAHFGFEAYLVGGCIRDILFGLQPKDFDVATSALPGEVKSLFRNCRLIGRRFRLAHLLFKKGKIIEVATFRRGATAEDDVSGIHAAENLFGGPGDDAIRRDFRINALMYDIGKREIHDYVGGLEDIEKRTISTIGDPDRRFPEDPVRIIRAAKFAARLDLQLEAELKDAMRRHAPLVVECSPARLVEEFLKILRSGAAARSMEMLLEVGVLEVLLPKLANKVGDTADSTDFWKYLRRLDDKFHIGDHVGDGTMVTTLIYPMCSGVLDEDGDVARKLEELLAELLGPMKFTKRHLTQVRQIFLAQRRIRFGPKSRRSRRLLQREYAADALDFFELIAETDSEKELLNVWLKAFASRRREPPPRRRRERSRSGNYSKSQKESPKGPGREKGGRPDSQDPEQS